MESQEHENCQDESRAGLDRRGFLGAMLMAAASAPLLSAAAAPGPPPTAAAKPAAPAPGGDTLYQYDPKEFPTFPTPPGGVSRKIKLGVLGLGQRGGWIPQVFLNHGGFELYAFTDYFPEVVDRAGDRYGVPKARRFSGLDGYKKMLACGIEAIVIIDVPHFYGEQALASVEAGMHIYMAKPVATDVPGCLAIECAGQLATQKNRVFLVDFQFPTTLPNIEVQRRVRVGGIGKLVHMETVSIMRNWDDPPKTQTIESRLNNIIWLSDVALGGDNIVSFDIHTIDGVVWFLGQRPVKAAGFSRTVRPTPHGDRTDTIRLVYEFGDGLIWSHSDQALQNNFDNGGVGRASIYGDKACASVAYGGKVWVRGGPQHYVGDIATTYNGGAACNVATFYSNIMTENYGNPTVRRAVDSTLTAILGREAAARQTMLTMEDLIKENKKLAVDLTGLKA